MLMIALDHIILLLDLELVGVDVPEVPVSLVIELDEPHVGTIYLGDTFPIPLDFTLKVICRLPPDLYIEDPLYIIELHLSCDLVHLISERHLTCRLELHGTPKTTTILLTRKIILHHLPIKELD